jgi:hypothetical protein
MPHRDFSPILAEDLCGLSVSVVDVIRKGEAFVKRSQSTLA